MSKDENKNEKGRASFTYACSGIQIRMINPLSSDSATDFGSIGTDTSITRIHLRRIAQDSSWLALCLRWKLASIANAFLQRYLEDFFSVNMFDALHAGCSLFFGLFLPARWKVNLWSRTCRTLDGTSTRLLVVQAKVCIAKA